ncbi:FGGY family carbohydrate kinase [Nonomuraea sp. NPDC049152]|uniref:FGGY-family carbohydrate kinase n=1 Tax=Nonomuraea sp. NPDC049152 TaxID=3154350 RepID=UPI0033D11C7B
MNEVWVGLDLGTQSVRALAVTGSGEVVGMGTRRLTSRREGVRHEQDPEQWWSAVATACAEALREVPAGAVRGVAVDATSGTVLLADAAGRPLTPGLMYDDTRAADEVERINDVGGAVWARLGYQRMQAAWALPKLLWLLKEFGVCGSGGEHGMHAVQKTRDVRLLHQSDFVNTRLTGHAVPSDLSSALKTGAHLIDEAWPADVFDVLGVPSEALPPLVRSGTVIGQVCAIAARDTGLPEGTPVIAGATDGCAAQLGAGALTPGSWNSVLGTTLVLKGVTRDLVMDPLGAVYSHKAPNGDWLPGGASSTGSGVIARDFPDRDLDDLTARAAAHEPAGPVAYPLVSAGERFPFVAPQARGFLLGDATDEAEHFAALLQGVAFVERLCFDYLDLLGAPVDGPLTLTGGATRSAYWCGLRADVLGRQVTLPENAEPALGMAVLAASPGRRIADVAAEMVRVRDRIDPRPGSSGRFDDAYLRLIDELAHRQWLPAAVAAHAHERTT